MICRRIYDVQVERNPPESCTLSPALASLLGKGYPASKVTLKVTLSRLIKLKRSK